MMRHQNITDESVRAAVTPTDEPAGQEARGESLRRRAGACARTVGAAGAAVCLLALAGCRDRPPEEHGVVPDPPPVQERDTQPPAQDRLPPPAGEDRDGLGPDDDPDEDPWDPGGP